MYNKNKMQYVVKTCSSDNVQELQNLLNEMSMNGWELYSMQEVETEEGFVYNCIFMTEAKSASATDNADVINISTFKSQMEKMLSPKLTPYESCLEIQSKIRHQKDKIAKIKLELEGSDPASPNRKKLNDKISAGLKELEDLQVKLAKATSPEVMYSKLQEEKLSINLSEELLGYVDSDRDSQEEELIAETVKSRLKLTEEIGYVIPKIIFKDDESLNPFEFCIKVRGMDVFRATIYPNHLMFYTDELKLNKKIKNSISDVDKITGKKIIWIEKNKTKDFWYHGLMGSEYITKALEYIVVKYVDELLDYEDLDKYIEVVNNYNPFLVENVIPDFISISDLRFILTSLIKERVSIKDLVYIFEKINDYAEDSVKADLLKKIRLALSSKICRQYENEDGTISAFELSDKTFEQILLSCEDGEDSVVKIDGDFAESIANKIIKQSKKLGIDAPKLLVPMDYRQLFYGLLSLYINNITVLANEEIGCNYKLEILGEI